MNNPFRILIVEDNLLTATTLKSGLADKEIEICGIATTYKEAVRLIKSEKPDLLLVDIELIGGEADGIAVAREFSRLKNAPILFLTGKVDPDVFKEASEVNPVAFLHKPFRAEEVKRQVTLALNNFYRNKQGVMVADYQALYVPDGQDKVRVNFEEIVYVVAAGSYTKIYLLRKNWSGIEKTDMLVTVNLANVRVHLPSNFLDVSRSLTINLHYLDRIGTRSLQMGPYEVELPAGKAKIVLEAVKLARTERRKKESGN